MAAGTHVIDTHTHTHTYLLTNIGANKLNYTIDNIYYCPLAFSKPRWSSLREKHFYSKSIIILSLL